MVGSAGLAVIAVGQQDVLAVGVPVDEQLNALAGSDRGCEGGQSPHLGSITRGLTLVRLSASRRGGAAGEFPLVGPVPIQIRSDARLAAA